MVDAEHKMYRDSLGVLAVVGILAGVIAGIAAGALWFTAAALVEVLRAMKSKGVEIQIPK